MDGGIRSGTDIFKAFALGADMVFVGRPIIFGLTVGVRSESRWNAFNSCCFRVLTV